MGQVIYMSKLCGFEGCVHEAAVRGYCTPHYRRQLKTGAITVRTATIAERGRQQDHPHFHRWKGMQSRGELVPAWESFWQFVDDIGDSGGCKKLLRLDESKPFGPGNFRWAPALKGERKNAYYREWFKNSPNQRDKLYQKQYGINLEDYEAMLEEQDGVCAICFEPPSEPVRRGVNEDARRLAVDHNHETGAVRGLLCAKCNQGLGSFRDNPQHLISALSYLKQNGEWPVRLLPAAS